MKYKIPKGSVQETLIIPLYGSGIPALQSVSISRLIVRRDTSNRAARKFTFHKAASRSEGIAFSPTFL